MKDTIYREDAIKAVEECLKLLARPRYTVRTAIEAIPSVDVDISEYSDKLWRNAYERGKADRPQGEWIDAEIPLESGGSMPIQVCNLCKTFYPLAYTGGGHRFCPNCGARMFAKDTNVPNKKGADDE